VTAGDGVGAVAAETAEPFHIAVVGAGPCGLGVGVAARLHGLSCVLFDRGCVAWSIAKYPSQMRFFSTPDRLELGELPFITLEEKPGQREALKYYRRVAQHFQLDVRQYEEVLAIAGPAQADVAFEIHTRHRGGAEATYRALNVVVATGYFDTPNLLDIPGEDLPNVFHYFQDADPFFDQRCVVIGAGNSAVDAALELFRVGAHVTLVHFGDRLDAGVKAWVLPDIAARLKSGEIAARWRSRVMGIAPDHVLIRSEADGRVERLPNDWVFAMTGYRPDLRLLQSLGVTCQEPSGIPTHDPETMETNVRGVFIAGVLAAWEGPDKVFIENGREHGPRIARAVAAHRRQTVG
jgi:bacillithiol disulfide reductase